MSSDIAALAVSAQRFGKELSRLKQNLKTDGFDWYPYHTLAAFPVLESMLRGDHRDLLKLAGAGRVLDIGCGDGDLSFFLASQGHHVTAIENPSTNYNRTRGFLAIGRELGGDVELDLQDLDESFSLGSRTYGLAFCLGVLYHLKNPYGFLERLARHSRYCVLSTRIAERTVSGTSIQRDPVAYLVSPSETNNDPTNYWIFSLAGFERIVRRTGWDLCEYALTGAQRRSDPARSDRDQRITCLLRSTGVDAWLDADLDTGWHAMEDGSWRWTERVFGVRLPRPASAQTRLRLRFRNPLGPVRVRAIAGSIELPWKEYPAAGEHVYEHAFELGATDANHVTVRFELDTPATPSLADRRELGLQVIFWDLDSPVPKPLRPIALE